MTKKYLLSIAIFGIIFLFIASYSFAFSIYPVPPESSPIANIFFELAGDAPSIDNFYLDASSYIASGDPIGLDVYLSLGSGFDSGLAGCSWVFLYDSWVFSPLDESFNDGDLDSVFPPNISTPGQIEFYSYTLDTLMGDIKIGHLELAIQSETPGSYGLNVVEGMDSFMLDGGTIINGNIQVYTGAIYIPSANSPFDEMPLPPDGDGPPVNSVPEPSAILLFCFSLFGLICLKEIV